MRRLLWPGLIAIVCCAALTGSRAEMTSLKGDYVEARTASVFAGACHYGGEYTTTGRDAVLAWQVNEGSWNGVDLAGVRAVAIVTSDGNLADARAERRSEVIVDTAASYAQSIAFVDAIKSKYASSLGRVAVVRSASVSFKRDGSSYSIKAEGFAAIDLKGMPDDLCCVMPQLVWYQPMVPMQGRKVGYTVNASYAGGSAGEAWERAGENSSFYGKFSL
jgi:hypothetical protein